MRCGWYYNKVGGRFWAVLHPSISLYALLLTSGNLEKAHDKVTHVVYILIPYKTPGATFVSGCCCDRYAEVEPSQQYFFRQAYVTECGFFAYGPYR